MKTEIDPKAILKKIVTIFNKIIVRVSMNIWYFTVAFLFIALVVSAWVWWRCVQNPEPSSEVLIKMNQSKVNYAEMKNSAESVISTLLESSERYQNPPFVDDQRELFWDYERQVGETPPAVPERSVESPDPKPVDEQRADDQGLKLFLPEPSGDSSAEAEG